MFSRLSNRFSGVSEPLLYNMARGDGEESEVPSLQDENEVWHEGIPLDFEENGIEFGNLTVLVVRGSRTGHPGCVGSVLFSTSLILMFVSLLTRLLIMAHYSSEKSLGCGTPTVVLVGSTLWILVLYVFESGILNVKDEYKQIKKPAYLLFITLSAIGSYFFTYIFIFQAIADLPDAQTAPLLLPILRQSDACYAGYAAPRP